MSGPVAIGFRAQRGGAVAVAVAADARGPRVVRSGFLTTAAEGDRLAFEPFHVAYEMAQQTGGAATPEIEAAVAEGRARQAAAAAEDLTAMLAQLRAESHEPAVAALLVNRAGWMADLLSHALSAPEHPPVMEGLAVREALRAAFRHCALPVTELDEKALPDTAAAILDLSETAMDARLKALGVGAKPWRKEQKLAALAAWIAAAAP